MAESAEGKALRRIWSGEISDSTSTTWKSVTGRRAGWARRTRPSECGRARAKARR